MNLVSFLWNFYLTLLKIISNFNLKGFLKMGKEIKIVGLFSSANFDGNGAKLIRETLKGAKENGASIEEIFLFKHKLHTCTGCLKCMSHGKCPLPDDFEEIKKTLYEADGIILCSPTFGGYMNGTMKNFFDRLGMFEKCTSMMGGKYLVGISTAGNAGTAKKVAKIMAESISMGIFKRSYISGILGASYLPNGVDKKPEILKDVYNLGGVIVQDIKANKKYPLQNLSKRCITTFFTKPIFTKFITNGRESNTKAVYNNLLQRGIL